MQRKGADISLSSYDDIFQTDVSRAENQQERVQQMSLDQLEPFKNHPFKVVDDEAMLRTTESIVQFGVLTPLIARPLEDGKYEIVSGHRRAHAAGLAGLTEVPVIVREMDDDQATVLMVDSNLQREEILPSERAFAYKMKNEAMKRSAGRPGKENVGQLVPDIFGKRTTEIIGEKSGDSYKQVQRYIRLTNLIPELLDMVDNKQIAFNPAVELSYLKEKEQINLLDAIEYAQATPSLSQAQRLKSLSQKGKCDVNVIREILSEEKKREVGKVTFREDEIRKYFPKSFSSKQIQNTIIKLLEQWKRKRDRNMDL